MFAASIVLLSVFLQSNGDYVEELVTQYGYPIEVHSNFITEDGYYLKIHRIPHDRGGNPSRKKQPVLLMHGMTMSSDSYLPLGPERSLGFLLADRGYDVWLGNVRSVSYSRKHLLFDAEDEIFWDFSMHELGEYDLPATIDYILVATNSTNLLYIGHSQGSTIMTIMLSEHPEYNGKVRLFVALSPVILNGQMRHPLLSVLARNLALLQWVFKSLGIYEFAPGRSLLRLVGPRMCKLPILRETCAFILMFIGGYDAQQLNKDDLPNIFRNWPEGISVYQLYHLLQISANGRFAKYDYGEIGNRLRYSQFEPPLYILENVRVPTALYYSENDWFVTPQCVELLAGVLPNVVDLHQIEYPNFTHLDFIFAKDIRTLLYDRVINLLSLY